MQASPKKHCVWPILSAICGGGKALGKEIRGSSSRFTDFQAGEPTWKLERSTSNALMPMASELVV